MTQSPESDPLQFHFEKGTSKACGCSDDDSPVGEGARWKGYYPLEDCLRDYCPEDEMAKEERRKRNREQSACKGEDKHECTKYCVYGVNLLNRESLEIHEIEERLVRRKEQHTKVERRRRQLINTSIEQLSQLLPPSYIDHRCKNARGLVLQQSIQYLHALKQENANLKAELNSNK